MSQDGPGNGGKRAPVPSAPTEGLPDGLLAPGQVLGDRYQIKSQLGRGGMGEVWRAFDLKLRVEVALKAMLPDLFRDEKRRDLLRREVRAAREVVSPNVCRIFDLIEVEGRELVSMEYVDGGTLLSLLAETGPLDLKEAQDIASQFLAGLEAIHQAGLVHRDVKPENIMITRAGRVVLMDFGLARQEDSGAGTVSGTPAYMAPEQAAGLQVDARADVYSAGVVLAEMVSPDGIKDYESRQSVWEGIRQEPARVPDSPWAPVLRKAVAKEPEQRHNSAHTLIRELEDMTLRVEGAEDLTPYPGLASFTEEDADYFFGREAEIEAMWSKLDRPHLLGLIGPSGAGKTSFIRAGVIPNSGSGWAIATCNPGNAAFRSLRQELASELAGDAEAMRELVDGEDLDATVSAVSRWRRRHEQALLIVDQFEELFTQNASEVQVRFSELLGRLVLEADVFVLLTMRDDFFFHCHQYEALNPVVTDLTLLGPPTGAALRRALVRPATKCGYHFEDSDLVEEMLAEVEGERGALPLLAFAMSRLWEKRDRDQGLITRQAYIDIGGVGGALARHAEATIDRIGSDRIGHVREIFRNLVTAEGTRAVREWDELLSVFSGSRSESPEEVLRQLIDARLLTSYEIREEDKAPTRRVEIIHESLLESWPRLVGWRTQDADSTRLRDELRQAARTWDEHDHSNDYLWTGRAYREFALWRSAYPGGLTGVEADFAAAMMAQNKRRKRRRRLAIAAAFVALLAVLVVVGVSRQQAIAEAQRAEAAAQRHEAAQLLALGQLHLEDHPNAALAYAIASLESSDNISARHFSVNALWQGPPALFLSGPLSPIGVQWSPDGRWMALTLRARSGIAVLDRDTEERGLIPGSDYPIGFTADSRRLLTVPWDGVTALRMWTLPAAELSRSIEPPGPGWPFVLGDRVVTLDPYSPEAGQPVAVHRIALEGEGVESLGRWQTSGISGYDLDPTATWIASAQEGRVVQQRLDDLSSPPRVLGTHDGEVGVWVRPWHDRVVTGDKNGEIRIWDVRQGRLERKLVSPSDARTITLDPRGRFLAAGPRGMTLSGRSLFLFDLDAPGGASPQPLLSSDLHGLTSWEFSPDGSWLGSAHAGIGALWNLAAKRAAVLATQQGSFLGVAFTSTGRLVTASNAGVVKLWPITKEAGDVAKELWSRPGGAEIGGFPGIDPHGRFVAVAERVTDMLHIIPLDGSRARVLRVKGTPGIEHWVTFAEVDPSGRYVAVGYLERQNLPENSIRVLDVETGEERILNTHPDGEARCETEGPVFEGLWSSDWLSDGRLVSDGDAGLRIWDLEAGTSKQLRPCTEGLGIPLMLATPDSQNFLRLHLASKAGEPSTLTVFHRPTGTIREVTSHGNRIVSMNLDPSGSILVTGSMDGVVRVGLLSGGEPRLLFGHSGQVFSVAVSLDKRWIAAGSMDETIRLWPMPDLSKSPLHTLPHDELLAKLRSLTNLRAVRDPSSNSGWKVEVGPFPGWAEVPEW